METLDELKTAQSIFVLKMVYEKLKREIDDKYENKDIIVSDLDKKIIASEQKIKSFDIDYEDKYSKSFAVEKSYHRTKRDEMLKPRLIGMAVFAVCLTLFILVGMSIIPIDSESPFFGILLAVFGIGGIVGAIFFFASYDDAGELDRYNKALRKIEDIRQQDIENFKKIPDLKKQKKKYEDNRDEAKVTLAYLKSKQDDCDKYIKDLEKAVIGFFAKTSIYSAYHDYIPVCQFIQYLESGRCVALTGKDGCYGLYESEINQGIIVSDISIFHNKSKQFLTSMREFANSTELVQKAYSSIISEIDTLSASTPKMDNLGKVSQDYIDLNSCDPSKLEAEAKVLNKNLESNLA